MTWKSFQISIFFIPKAEKCILFPCNLKPLQTESPVVNSKGFAATLRALHKLERNVMKQVENAIPHSPHHCVALRRDHRRFSDVDDRVWQQISKKKKDSEKRQFLSED